MKKALIICFVATGLLMLVAAGFTNSRPDNKSGRQSYVSWYYTDSAQYSPIFEYVDVFSLPAPELEDSLSAAMAYVSDQSYFERHNFCYFIDPTGLPSAWRTRMLVYENGEETEIREVVPFEERRIRLIQGRYKEGKGMPSYLSLAERLSANRMCTDFYELYKKYGWLFRKVVSKDVYDLKYSKIVDKLLIAYDDLGGDEAKYDFVGQIMAAHWDYCRNVPNYEAYIDNFYPALTRIMGPGTEEKLQRLYNMDKTEPSNEAVIVWAYSFWNRRLAEGKRDEIHNLLTAIKQDYSGM